MPPLRTAARRTAVPHPAAPSDCGVSARTAVLGQATFQVRGDREHMHVQGIYFLPTARVSFMCDTKMMANGSSALMHSMEKLTLSWKCDASNLIQPAAAGTSPRRSSTSAASSSSTPIASDSAPSRNSYALSLCSTDSPSCAASDDGLPGAVALWNWELNGVTEISKECTREHGEWPDAAALSNWTEELLQSNIGQLSTERIGPMGPGRRQVVCRIENFCGPATDPAHHHAAWRDFAMGPLRHAVSKVCGEEMELYKEKLNLKPAGGGGGFAPHIDSPSLRIFTHGQPWAVRTFVTAMVAIDDMTEANGCLRLATPEAGAPC